MNENTETALWEIVGLLKEIISLRTVCKKTLSGKHLFMPIFGEWIDPEEQADLKIWYAHGVRNPMKCINCDLIDDTKEDETNT